MSAADIRLAFVGDDFTGSIDTMETLNSFGISTVLFLDVPDAALVARFGKPGAIGIATEARAMSPSEMDNVLPKILADLINTGAPVIHYKICSTFDSSRHSGSIGHVLSLASTIFDVDRRWIVLGQPNLGRYGVFGTLFARMGTDGDVYRIDRHPSMSRHPITPMHEADIPKHIQMQADVDIGVINYLSLRSGKQRIDDCLLALKTESRDAILLDVADDDCLNPIGNLIGESAREGNPAFVIGPSSVEQAMATYWEQGDPPPSKKTGRTSQSGFAGVERLLAVSGSASPITAEQIDHAVSQGFTEIAVNPVDLIRRSQDLTVNTSVIQQIQKAFKAGNSVILHTCKGPADSRLVELAEFLSETSDSVEAAALEAGTSTAKAMAKFINELLLAVPVERLCLAGGDFSSAIARNMKLSALSVISLISPGVSLCIAHSENPVVDGLELALKGGQMGKLNYFSKVRDGLEKQTGS